MWRLAAALGAALPARVAACPACGPVDERSQAAYVVATAFLIAVPIAIVAGGGLWLARHYGAGESADETPGEPGRSDRSSGPRS